MNRTVGHLGIGEYKAYLNGKKTKVYVLWDNIIKRCYNPIVHAKYPTYIDCTMHSDWHTFQIFAKWYEENYVEGYHLDKDILYKGNKVYGPDTCCFVPREINNFLLERAIVGKEYPLGVTKRDSKFQARISKEDKEQYLGRFITVEEASQAYRIAKESYAKELADKYKETINDKAYKALYKYTVNNE